MKNIAFIILCFIGISSSAQFFESRPVLMKFSDKNGQIINFLTDSNWTISLNDRDLQSVNYTDPKLESRIEACDSLLGFDNFEKGEVILVPNLSQKSNDSNMQADVEIKNNLLNEVMKLSLTDISKNSFKIGKLSFASGEYTISLNEQRLMGCNNPSKVIYLDCSGLGIKK